MAKLTEKYESLIVLNTKKGEDEIKTLIEKVKKLISDNAALDNVDEWGKRRLAYEIEDETEGYYVLFHFTSNPSFPAELERVLNITDGVLRSLVTLQLPEAEAPKAAEKVSE